MKENRKTQEKEKKKQAKKRFRPGRFLLWFFLVLVLLLFITPLLLFRTQMGVQFIENTVNGVLGQESMPVRMEITGLSGSLPFDIRIGRFEAKDEEGLFLDARALVLSLSFTDLLTGCIHVEELSGKNLALYRLPTLPPKKEEPEKTKEFSMPSLPEILVDKLLLEEIFIGKSILGEDTVLHLKGFLANDTNLLSSTLSLGSLEGLPIGLSLEAVFKHKTHVLDLKGHFSEEKGQLSTLLKLPPLPLSLDLNGNGEPGEWLGRLDFLAGEKNALATDLKAVWEKGWPSITLTGKIALDPDLLPGTLDPFLSFADIRAHLFEDLEKNGLFADLTIKNDKMELDFDAGLLRKNNEIEADLLLAIAKPDELSPVEKLSPGSEVLLEAKARGTIQEPEIEGHLILVEPFFREFHFERLELKSDFKFTSEKKGSRGIHGLGFLETTGLSNGPRNGPSSIHTDFDFMYLFSEKDLVINHFEMKSEDSLASVKGSIMEANKVDAQVELDLDRIGSWASLFMDMPVTGSGQASAQVKGAFSPLKFDMEILSNIEGLSGLPDPIPGLAAEKVTLEGKAGMEETESKDLKFAVLDMKMKSSTFNLVTDGSYSNKKEEIDLVTKVSLPNLSPLFPKLGMKGSTGLTGEIKGKLNDFSYDLALSSKDFFLPQTGNLPFNLDLEGRRKNSEIKGNLAFNADTHTVPTKLISEFSFMNQKLAIPVFNAILPGLTVNGHGEANLGKPLITAELTGNLEDGAKLGAIAGLSMKGNGNFKLSLFGSETGQNLNLDALFSSLGFNEIGLGHLEAKGGMQDLFGKGNVNAEFLAKNLVAGDISLQETTGKAEGPLSALSIVANTKGDAFGPILLDLNGEYGLKNSTQKISLAKLDGTWSNHPFKLEKNWDITIDNKGISAEALNFSFEEAKLVASGFLQTGKVKFDLDLDNFPASIIPLGAQGRLQAKLHVEGSPASPRINLDFTGKDIKPQDVSHYEGPGIQPQVIAQFSGQTLSFDMKIWESRESTPMLTGTGTLPMVLSLQPFKFEIKNNASVRAKLDGIAKLDRIGPIVMPSNQLVKGDLQLDLAMSGSLTQPTLAGNASLSQGSYQHLEQGVFLKDMDIDLMLSPERLEIVKLLAKDINGGSLEGRGGIYLSQKDYPFEASVKTGKFQALNSPTIFAVLKDANLEFTGNLRQQLLKGEVNLERVEYFIKDFGGPNIPELDVTEIPAPEGQTKEKPEKQRPFSPRLDLKVDAPARLFVRGRGLETEWKGDLKITGVALNPAIRGTIELVRGRMDFLGKRLDLEEGTITLDGSRPPNPYIAIKAEQDGKEVLAILKIEGQPSHLKFTLSSEPTLPEDEVLSHMLFGRSISAISPLQAAQLAWALGELAGYTDGVSVFGMARDMLGLDDFNLVSDGDDEDDLRLRAGKYVSERVYLKVEKDLKTDDDLVSADVELSRRLSFESKIGPKGGGVGLFWKRDF